jgi:hypothetical protein
MEAYQRSVRLGATAERRYRPGPEKSYSYAMHSFYRAFHRNADGSWTCTAPATLNHPRGRVQVTEGSTFFRGTTFMGIDIVEWLEEQHEQLAPEESPRAG